MSHVRVVVVSGVRTLREGVTSRLRGNGLDASPARPGEAATRIEAARAAWSSGEEPAGQERRGDLTSAGGARASRQPVVALVDHLLPDLPSIVARLAARASVVVFGVPERDATVIACAEAGAVGYVPVDASLAELRDVLTTAAQGETEARHAQGPSLVFLLMRRLAALTLAGGGDRRGHREGDRGVALTLREREIAHLLERGFSNEQIAARLQIAVPIVKTHVHSLLARLYEDRQGETATQFRSWLSSILALPPLPSGSPS